MHLLTDTVWESDLLFGRLQACPESNARKETRRCSSRFDFIADHRGMFSRLALTEAQVDRLRDEFGIYMVGDSRFNVAGLKEGRLDDLAGAIRPTNYETGPSGSGSQVRTSMIGSSRYEACVL
ncbi:hypothetical protein [Rhizobium favelukesii]|uniref:Uncharacterized protein n=2 Tax=Rhizobium TaxID=379 RepID=W6RMB6_9HYPH|nr:hypothetical protein [Rhizobium favelukesii]CDM62267.1 hypothetical protein LPU83_pLPU83d_0897 [Rhizobium favelukesii]